MKTNHAEDLLTLTALAEAVLDAEPDTKTWCRGVGTTPAKLGKIVERVKAFAGVVQKPITPFFIVVNTLTEGGKNAPSTAFCTKGEKYVFETFDEALDLAVEAVMEQQSDESKAKVRKELKNDHDFADVGGAFTVTILEV